MGRLREFTLMEGDLLPELEFTVQNDDGAPVDLTACTAVVFLMATRPDDFTDSVNVVAAAATFVDKPNGVVKYTWASGDTDQRGKYVAVFELTEGLGKKFTVPNDDYIYVRILARLPAV